MIRIHRWLAAGLVAAVLTIVSAARAEHGLVVIIGPSSDHPTVAQVRNELLLLGFDVSVLWSAAPVAELAEVGKRYGAVAVARVIDWPPEVVVWVAPDRDSSPQSASSEIYVSDSLAEPAEHRLLALGAVELLRGRLLHVSLGDNPDLAAAEAGRGQVDSPAASEATPLAPPSGSHAASATAAPPVPPTPGRAERPDTLIEPPTERRHGATVRLRPAVLFGPNGMRATPHVYPGATFDLFWRVGVDVDVLIPTTAAAITADQGRVDVRTLLLTSGLSVDLTPEQSAWMARVGLGAGAAGLFFAGDADAPYEGRDGSRWAVAPYASLVGGYWLHPMVGVRADALIAVFVPEPVVRIAEQEVASLGRPAFALGAGMEVRP